MKDDLFYVYCMFAWSGVMVAALIFALTTGAV